MGNFGTTIKRFITNKNTVTLLVIIACTVLLYIVYNNRVKNAVSTTYVCYALEGIPARTEITSNMVSTKKVLTSQVTSNMITDCGSIVGRYVSYATEVPVNGYFFESMLMDKGEMPDSVLDKITDGNTLFKLPVSFESTFGNAIFPDDYIDLYLKTTNEDGNIIYGKFIESIKVLAVRDAQGKNVFETTLETRTPSQLLFSVPEDLHLLLMKAYYLGLEIVVVPRNSNYTANPGETKISSTYLKDIIEDRTGDIPDECVLATTPTAECKLASSEEVTTPVENTPEE